MAVLENIRKRTTVLILIIGLALFAFVISGVFTSSDFGSGGKVGSSVAEINGNELSIDDFREKVEIASRRVGPSASSLQVMNQVWDQEVRNSILGGQFDDLGIGIEQDQIVDFLETAGYGQNPQFQDENGVFDPNLFRQTVMDWKVNNPPQYEAWLQTEEQIVQMAREAGAAKVYFASAAPPVRHPNVYGIDMPATSELVASGKTDEEVCGEVCEDIENCIDVETCETVTECGGENAECQGSPITCSEVTYSGDCIEQSGCGWQ